MRPVLELIAQCRNFASRYPRGMPEKRLFLESAEMMESLMVGGVSVEAVETALGTKGDGTQRRLAPWQVEALGGREVG